MKIFSKTIAFIFGITIFLCYSFVVCPTVCTKVLANTIYSAEEYTNSDALLKADGSSSTKSIRDFADEVKVAPYITNFDKLSEVIPAQYLNSTEPNAVYQYNG